MYNQMPKVHVCQIYPFNMYLIESTTCWSNFSMGNHLFAKSGHQKVLDYLLKLFYAFFSRHELKYLWHF